MYVHSLGGGWGVSATSQHPLGRGDVGRGRRGAHGVGWGRRGAPGKAPPAISVSVNVKNVRHLVPRETFKRSLAYSSTDAFFLSFFFLAHGEGKTKVTSTAACARGVEFYVQPQLMVQLD